MDQGEIFLKGEGDAWYQRNQESLERIQTFIFNDIPFRFFGEFNLHGHATDIVELGCATGYRLEMIRQIYGGEVAGLDASELAIQRGRLRFPNVKLIKGDACFTPFEDRSADVVIVYFLFHWIDRPLELANEVDRILRTSGHLILGDFLPDYQCKVPYKHKEGVWTYKQDYSRIFKAIGYHEDARIVFNHDTGVITTDASHKERAVCSLLTKGGYPVCEQ